VPGTIEELLQQAGSKLNINAEKAFTEGGAQLDDVRLIRDDEKLYISSGEPFFKSTGTYKHARLRVGVFDADLTHICVCLRACVDTRVRQYKVAVIGSGGVGKSCLVRTPSGVCSRHRVLCR